MTKQLLFRLSWFLPLLMMFTSCSERLEVPYSDTRFALGTTCTITVYRNRDIDAVDDAFEVVQEVESLMSAHLESSEVAELNRNAGEGPVSLSRESWYLLGRALEYATISRGAFDPAIGPLVELWGIGDEDASVPASEELQRTLGLVDFRKLHLYEEPWRAELAVPGMGVDLGAIAKGYAADRAAQVLRDAKVPWAIINFGGNVLTLGDRFGEGAWRIGIQDPDDERGAFIAVVRVTGEAVVTSGKYERFFLEEGRRYHHILSTRDGWPIENGIASVSAISADATAADAFSTLLFALGPEDGLALARETEGLRALFVMEDGRILVSRDPEGWLALESDEYRIEFEQSASTGDSNDK